MSRTWIRSALLGVVLVSLSARSGAADPVSPQVLESLIKGQPNHAADYTLVEPDGKSRVIRYAVRDGWSFIGTVPADALNNPYVVRTPEGKAFVVNPKQRTYAELSNTLFLFDPPLQTLETSMRLSNGSITADDKGSGTFAGHPIQRFVVKFNSEEMKREVKVVAAKDLRLLLLNLEMRGGFVGGFSITLSNVALDPPEGMFRVPAEYKEVTEESLEQAEPDTSKTGK